MQNNNVKKKTTPRLEPATSVPFRTIDAKQSLFFDRSGLTLIAITKSIINFSAYQRYEWKANMCAELMGLSAELIDNYWPS
jgi:hypothetical protein